MPKIREFFPKNKITYLIKRLLDKRYIDKETGCWNWFGNCNAGGYGQICFNNKPVGVRRIIAYICLNFDLNNPLDVCHKCDNKRCFNPTHLFIGTRADNLQDASKKGRLGWNNQKKNRCKRGHEFTDNNSIIRKNGTKTCRTCKINRYRTKKGLSVVN
jgi:HNH endonuclease